MAMFAPSYHNITEEIFLKEDGSGNYNVYTNKIPTMKQAIMERIRAEKEYSGEEAVLGQMADTEIWSENSNTFNYSTNLLQDASEEVLEDPKKLALLKNITGFTSGSKSKNFINTGVMCKFNNLEELALLMDLVRSNPLRDFKTLELPSSSTQFDIKKNKFSKSQKTPATAAVQVPPNSGKFKTIVILPKSVKKVKGKNLVSKKGQMVTFEYDLADVLSGKADTDFKVKWKK